MTRLTPQQELVAQKLQTDLEFFCKETLKIKLKEGGDGPFIWNKAQHYIHQRAEDQLRRTGMVRMFVLKGRQQGLSTYIEGRFYFKVTRARGKRAFILSHHSNTTEILFQMVEKYHQGMPAFISPVLDADNNRRMEFNNGSQYTVATASSGAGKAAGSINRGDTNQFLHWSEAAFCDNTGELLKGVVQTVSEADGTEIFIESTANGIGNYFHRGAMAALRGEGVYELVFIPWFWQDEYRSKLRDEDLLAGQCTDEEHALIQQHQLDFNQLQWRRNKIASLENGIRDFKQEYPNTVEEAFQASGERLIDPDLVAAARKSTLTHPNAPIIIGVDPARGGDRTVFCWRQGRHILKTEIFRNMDQMTIAGKLAQRIEKYNIARVFVDMGEGAGTVDRLRELSHGKVVCGVYFAQSPIDDERYTNKRAEIAGLFEDWFKDGPVRIPDDEEFAVDIASIPDFKVNSNGKRQLIEKSKIKEILGKSPDLFDAACLTFTEPVASDYQKQRKASRTTSTQKDSVLDAQRRVARKQKTNYDNDDFDYTPTPRTPLRRQI